MPSEPGLPYSSRSSVYWFPARPRILRSKREPHSPLLRSGGIEAVDGIFLASRIVADEEASPSAAGSFQSLSGTSCKRSTSPTKRSGLRVDLRWVNNADEDDGVIPGTGREGPEHPDRDKYDEPGSCQPSVPIQELLAHSSLPCAV